MFDLGYILAVLGATCLLFGGAYPAFMLLAYPLYRAFGGRESLREYLSCL